MNTQKLTSAILVSAALAFGTTAQAVNITIDDPNVSNKVGSTLYTETGLVGWNKGNVGAGASSEYQEVEPGMITGSNWDLAAFTALGGNGGRLGILSGFNLAAGEPSSGTNFELGDIFVEIGNSSNTLYGDPNDPYPQYTRNGGSVSPVVPAFNFDFALRLNFGAGLYEVIQLDANTVLESGFYANGAHHNAASNPWRVATTSAHGVAGGNLGTVIGTYALNYTNTSTGGIGGTSSVLAGFTVTNDYKYYAELQHIGSWLNAFLDPLNPVAAFHVTMECGNDNMYGVQSGGFITVPEQSLTLALLGAGILGLLALHRLMNRR